MARPSSGLRDRLLASALRLFVQHGFRGTSLQDIASDVGRSKASLLYHFSSKEAILTELLAPVGEEAAALDARLAGLAGEAAAVGAVTGFADLALRYRRELKLLFDNLSDVGALPDAGSEGLDGIGDRLVDALAGRSGEPRDRVAAVMVLGGMFVVGAGEVALDDEILREAMVASALRALGRAPG